MTGARLGPSSGVHRLRAAIVLSTLLGCAAPSSREDASLQPSDQVASIEQALSADPGPKDLFVTGSRFDRFSDARSDGTYLYVHYYVDSDRYCWGRVLRVPVGGGDVSLVEAPCFTRAFAMRSDGVYFATVYDPFTQSSGGIYHATFGVEGATRLTTTAAQAIAADDVYLYWDDGAALHRVLPDGGGDEILATEAAGLAPLLVDGTSVYGYDGAALWRVPKRGGERTTLATVGTAISGLQLDGRELFWVDTAQLFVDGSQPIQRLPVTGGTPRTFYTVTTNGTRVGLAVERGWVYWSTGLDIKRRAKMGGMIADVDTAEPSSELIFADATNVYYTRWTTPAPPWAALRRLPVADIVAPVCGEKPRTLVDAVGPPLGLSASGTWVYYTEGDTVRRVWKNGGSVETMAVGQPGARALHADAHSMAWVTDEGVNTTPFEWPSPGSLYAADAEDAIGAVDGVELYYTDGAQIVGPGGMPLATGDAPYRLARDSSWLYWTDRGDRAVLRVPLAGGGVQVVARVASGEIGDLDLDSNEVFFAVDRGGIGTILRVAKTGGAVALVTKGAFSPLDLEASGAYLYFTSQGPGHKALYRVAKSGGRPVARVKDGRAFELGTLQSCVYYATDAGVSVVSKF